MSCATTATQLFPKLARWPTACSLLTLFFRVLRAALLRASQSDRNRRGLRERLHVVAVAARASASASVVSHLATRLLGGSRSSRSPSSHATLHPVHCPPFGVQARNTESDRVLAASCDLSHGSGVLLLVALNACEVDLRPVRGDEAEVRGVDVQRGCCARIQVGR